MEKIMTVYFSDIVGHPLKSIGRIFEIVSGHSRLERLDPDLRAEALEGSDHTPAGHDGAMLSGMGISIVPLIFSFIAYDVANIGPILGSKNADAAAAIISLAVIPLTLGPLIGGQLYTAYKCSQQAKRHSGDERTPNNMGTGNNQPAPL